jgi:ribosomal protein L11 methyltransferase
MTVWSVTLTVAPQKRDTVIAELWEVGTTGITEDDLWLRAFFDETADSDAILPRFAAYQPRFEKEEPQDWVRYAQSMWQPVAVGRRLWLAPEWIAEEPPQGRLRLDMRPGLACGSGWHPATQLCLEAMEEIVTESTPVLDVGTGSGILADAARLLGAPVVVGCDIDHDATRVARTNLPEIAFFTGSLRSVRDRSFAVAVANLNEPALRTTGSDLRRVAREAVIVSGFREEEQETVARHLGGRIVRSLELEGWACLIG